MILKYLDPNDGQIKTVEAVDVSAAETAVGVGNFEPSTPDGTGYGFVIILL